MLDPCIGFLTDTIVCAEDMRHLGPYPLGRIDAAFVGGVVDTPAFRQFVDLGGFPDGGMVFPKDEHRIRVFCIFGQQGEGSTVLVGQDRRASGRIESNANYVLRCPVRALCECILYRGFQPFYVVQWMLAVLVFCGITVFPFHPAGIVLDSRSHFAACRSIDDYGATGIAAVVQAYNILFVCHDLSL